MGREYTLDELLQAGNAAPSEPRREFTLDEIMKRAKGIPRVVNSTGPGVGAAFARGLTTTGPSQAAGLLGSAGDLAIGAAERVGILTPGSVRPAGDSESFGQAAEESARSSMQELVGIDEPATQAERTAQAAGEGLFTAGMMAPVVAPYGPLAVGAELALGTIGGAVSEDARAAAEERGMGELGQAGASIGSDFLVTMAAPSMIVAKGADVVQGAKTIKEAIEATPEVKKAAEKLGVPVNQLFRTSSEFKRNFPIDPYGNESYIDEAADTLADAQRLWGESPETIPTTRQILNKKAGSAIANLEETLGSGKAGQDFPMMIEGRRRASLDDLQKRYESLNPEASVDEGKRAYYAIRDMRSDKVDELWDSVRAQEKPMIDATEAKRGALESIQRAGEDWPDDVPEEVAKILEWPDEVDFDRWQKARSRLLRSQRLGKRGVGETAAGHRADNMGPIIDAFNRTLDNLPTEGVSDEYRRALAATRKLHEDFDPKSAVVRGFEDYTEGKQIVGKILRAKDPAGEASRARRLLSQDPMGAASFERMLMDEMIGPVRLDEANLNGALKKLFKNENAARAGLGSEKFDNAVTLLKRAQMSSVGRAGKSSAPMSVGSGQIPLELALSSSRDFVDPAGMASSAVMKLIKKTVTDDSVRIGILREAMLDPNLAELLLRMPTERGVEAWAVNWLKLVNKANAGRIVTRETSSGGEK